VHFFLCDWKVFDSAGNDQKLTFLDSNIPISKSHQQPALQDKKQLVFCFVVVPHELTFEFHQFHKGIVKLSDDLGAPVIVEGTKLFAQADSFYPRCVLHSRSERRQPLHGVSSSVGRAYKLDTISPGWGITWDLTAPPTGTALKR